MNQETIDWIVSQEYPDRKREDYETDEQFNQEQTRFLDKRASYIEGLKRGYLQYAAELSHSMSEILRKYDYEGLIKDFSLDADYDDIIKNEHELFIRFHREYWRPTERQLKALEIAISLYEEFWPDNNEGELKSLLNDLKEL